jgi:hypothetical protein
MIRTVTVFEATTAFDMKRPLEEDKSSSGTADDGEQAPAAKKARTMPFEVCGKLERGPGYSIRDLECYDGPDEQSSCGWDAIVVDNVSLAQLAALSATVRIVDNLAERTFLVVLLGADHAAAIPVIVNAGPAPCCWSKTEVLTDESWYHFQHMADRARVHVALDALHVALGADVGLYYVLALTPTVRVVEFMERQAAAAFVDTRYAQWRAATFPDEPTPSEGLLAASATSAALPEPSREELLRLCQQHHDVLGCRCPPAPLDGVAPSEADSPIGSSQ